MISEQQIDSYRENGYVAVENVFAADQVAALRRATDELVEKSRSVTEHSDIYDLEPGHTADVPRVRRVKNPILHDPAFDQALRNPGMLNIVEKLIGPGIRYQNTKLNMKSPGYGSPVQWHQDWGFYPHTNDDILAVGVAIDDMTEQNGCLLVVPGSHRGPVHDHHEDGVFVGAVTDRVIDDADAAKVTVAAGGITIHHVRTLHASAPNLSPHARRLLLLEMTALDAWPLLGFGTYEQFNERILRGSPTNRPRIVPVDARIPEPKHERAGSIYEIQTRLSRPQFPRAK